MEKLKHIEHEADGEECERTETILRADKSGRGFGVISFSDKYGSECSIQDSSIATEPCIWLGVDKIEPKVCVAGEGWKPFPIPEDVLLNSRMHLTQSMVKQILPFLTKFAETGDYVTQMEEWKTLPPNK